MAGSPITPGVMPTIDDHGRRLKNVENGLAPQSQSISVDSHLLNPPNTTWSFQSLGWLPIPTGVSRGLLYVVSTAGVSVTTNPSTTGASWMGVQAGIYVGDEKGNVFPGTQPGYQLNPLTYTITQIAPGGGPSRASNPVVSPIWIDPSAGFKSIGFGVWVYPALTNQTANNGDYDTHVQASIEWFRF